MDDSIDVAVGDEVDRRVVAFARYKRKGDPSMEVDDRQAVVERNPFDSFDVVDVPQRPREQLRVRGLGNEDNRTRDACRTIYHATVARPKGSAPPIEHSRSRPSFPGTGLHRAPEIRQRER